MKYEMEKVETLVRSALESVSRARRKLQSANEDLRGSLENQKAREERQMDMFEYALKK